MTTTIQETTAPQSPVVDAPLTDVERRARVLEAAALEIEVRGWAQRALFNGHGQVCAAGAVACADGWPPNLHGALPRLPDGMFCWGDVVEFNNAEGRTASDVTFLLRWRAAELRDGWDAA